MRNPRSVPQGSVPRPLRRGCCQVFSATIAFATSLFWGGNSVVQDMLLQSLRTDTALAFIRTLANKVRQSLVRFRDWKSELAFVTSKAPDSFKSRIHQDSLQAKTDVIEIEGVLRFLQLLCEGHHLELQNYLREQSTAGTSVNIVPEIMRFLNEVSIPRPRTQG